MSTATVPARLSGHPTRPRRADRSARDQRAARTRHPAGRARGPVRPALVAIDPSAVAVTDAGEARHTVPARTPPPRLVPVVDGVGVLALDRSMDSLGTAARPSVAGSSAGSILGSVAVPLLVPAPAGAPVRWTPRALPETRRAARPVPRPAVRRAPVRLTRRARLLLTLLATGAVLGGLLSVLGAPQVGTFRSVGSLLGAGSTPVAAERVTVRPGDTLWAIAKRVAPGSDPRETVAQIEALNHLSSSDVQAGVALQVPARP